MTALARAFRAERVKLRKSWPMLTAVLAPLCQAGFLGIIFWFSGQRLQLFKPGFRFWLELNHMTWNLVLMPICTALVCALSWDQEREARAWDRLLAQPLPRHIHYLAKLAGHLSLLFLSQALLALALALGGWILQHNPELLMGSFPAGLWLKFTGYSALAALAIAGLQTWLSMRIPSLWAVLAIALAGTWLTLNLLDRTPLIQFLPWGLADQMVLIFDRRRVLPWTHSLGSLASAALLMGLGTADFSRRRGPRT